MGSSNSKVLGYRQLRNSIPGLLVEEKDFSLFYSLCKIETSRTISNVLYPSSTQLFYVVLSGEVYVQLSVTGSKPIQSTTFTVGETIHVFNAKLRTNSANFEFTDAGDCLRNGDVKLSLHFKSYATSPARVIGMDRRGYDEFKLKSRSNIYAITSFVNMNMAEFFQTSTSFQTMTAKQVLNINILLDHVYFSDIYILYLLGEYIWIVAKNKTAAYRNGDRYTPSSCTTDTTQTQTPS